MITHVKIYNVKLTKSLTNKILKFQTFKDNIIQIKQASNNIIVIECDLMMEESNMEAFKMEIKDLTESQQVDLVYTENKS